jgi:WD40 repeat protein
VLDLDIGNGVITSVASSLDGQEAYVANARGLFEIVDLRAGKTRGRFKGNSGSIRQISVHPSGTHVACAGLDQYVRVYDVRTRKCVSTVFAKQPLTSVMFDARTLEYEVALAERAKAKKKTGKAKKRVDDAYDDDAYDDGEIVVKKKKTKTITLTHDDGREIVKKLKKKKKKTSTDELEDATEKKKKKKSKKASVHIE